MPEAFEIEGGVLRKYRGGEAHVVIPDGVTRIGEEAFRCCEALASVSIPKGVTEIGESAFCWCFSLQSVAIPDSVTRIGYGAFEGCMALASISIPEGVTEIGYGAFKCCTALASVSIPEGVTEIGGEAFYGCEALASLEIPRSVTRIGGRAFAYCKSLASVSIPEGVTEIGERTFEGCESLAIVAIPEGVTRIGKEAFMNCGALASVSIPEGVNEIGESAFYWCRNLRSVAIPESVTEIGDGVFHGCEVLPSVSIPEGVTEIGRYAFEGCKSLASVSVPEGVTRIGYGAFTECTALAAVVVPESVAEIGKDAFGFPPATVVCPEGSYAHRHCDEMHIPFVFDYQFEAFHGLLPQGFERLASPFLADEEGPFVFVSYSHKDREEVLPVIKELYEQGWRIWYDEGLTIGDSYDETLEEHVRNCATFLLFTTPNSLESVYIEANEVPWAVAYGRPIVECTLEGEGRYPIQGGSAVAVASPSGIGLALEQVEGLVKGVPREAKGITVVVDPAARDAATGGGFACCLYSESGAAAAKAIMLEARRAGCALRDEVEEGLGQEGLSRCACLVAFLNRAFLEDEALLKPLVDVYRAGGDVAVCALEDVEGSELPEGLSGLDKEHWLVCSHGITADLNAQLARHLQRLGCRDTSALPGFEYEKTGKGIVITRYTGLDPSPRIEASYGGVPVVEIADRVFEGCVHLKEVDLPEGVARIGDWAFFGCEALASVEIPNSVTLIGDGAFASCKALTSASIPDGMTKIGDRTFSGCENLASVAIPEGVIEIGKSAFFGCNALASVLIPASVTEVGFQAFAFCQSLASVSIPEGVTRIAKWAFEGCPALASVSIPDSVREIGDDAFRGCEKLTVECSRFSKAWSYCRGHGIRTEPSRSGFFGSFFGKK